jgi:hypothetical protein
VVRAGAHTHTHTHARTLTTNAPPTPCLLLQMRAKFAAPPGTEPEQPVRDATAFDAILGAVQAAALGFGMFIFSSKMTMVGS